MSESEGPPLKRRRFSTVEPSPAAPVPTPAPKKKRQTSVSKTKKASKEPALPKVKQPLICLSCKKQFKLRRNFTEHVARCELFGAAHPEPCPYCSTQLVRGKDGELWYPNPRSKQGALIPVDEHFDSDECQEARQRLQHERHLGPISPSKRDEPVVPDKASGKVVGETADGNRARAWRVLAKKEGKASEAYIKELNEQITYSRARFTGESVETYKGKHVETPLGVEDGWTQQDAKAPPPFSRRWRSDELNRFFYALSRFSRLRPDLIAEHVGTRTVSEVDSYIRMLAECAEVAPPFARNTAPVAHEMSQKWVRWEERQAMLADARGADDGLTWRQLCLLGEDNASEYGEEEELPLPPAKGVRIKLKKGVQAEPEDKRAEVGGPAEASVDPAVPQAEPAAPSRQATPVPASPAASPPAAESPEENAGLQADSMDVDQQIFEVPEHSGPISPSKALLAALAHMTTQPPNLATDEAADASLQEVEAQGSLSAAEKDADVIQADKPQRILKKGKFTRAMEQAQASFESQKVKPDQLKVKYELLELHAVGALIDAYRHGHENLGIEPPEACLSTKTLDLLMDLVRQHVRGLLVKIFRLAELRHAGNVEGEELTELVEEVLRCAKQEGQLDTKNRLLSLRTQLYARQRLKDATGNTPFYAKCPHCEEMLFAGDVDPVYLKRNMLGNQPEWLNMHLQKCKPDPAVLPTPTLPPPVVLWPTTAAGVDASFRSSRAGHSLQLGAIALPNVFKPALVRPSPAVVGADPDALLAEDFDEKGNQNERWEEVHLNYEERLQSRAEEERLWRTLAKKEPPMLRNIRPPNEFVEEKQKPIKAASIKPSRRAPAAPKATLPKAAPTPTPVPEAEHAATGGAASPADDEPTPAHATKTKPAGKKRMGRPPKVKEEVKSKEFITTSDEEMDED